MRNQNRGGYGKSNQLPPTRKAGVGKSTLCIQQAFYLALQKKKKVLVLDMDGQGNTSSRLALDEELEDGDYEPILTGTKTAELFALRGWTALRSCTCPCGADLIHTPKNDPDLFEMEAVPLDQSHESGSPFWLSCLRTTTTC